VLYGTEHVAVVSTNITGLQILPLWSPYHHL